MKVLFVGQNPSKANLDPNIPFVGTKSEKVLNDWIEKLGVTKYYIVNASQKIGKVTTKDADESLIRTAYGFYVDGYEIVALGNYASKICKKYGIEHFKLPHPSGLNRKLNDPKYVSTMLKECKKYLTTAV